MTNIVLLPEHNELYGTDQNDILFGGLFMDWIVGGDGDDILYGMAGDDALFGEAGDDTLHGGDGADYLDGGKGKDTLIGGDGDDIYIVDNKQDQVTELDGEGIDIVFSSVDFVLSDHIENLTLTGGALNGTGNDLDNILTGNTHRNFLDGRAGADTMIGGEGDDLYYVDDASDVVVEYAGEGNDRVLSEVTYKLWKTPHVENLALVGNANVDAIGSWKNNVIDGNSGNNLIIGGKGNDILSGGGGNDIFQFTVDNGYNGLWDFGHGQDVIKFVGTSANSFDDLMTHTEGDELWLVVDGTVVILDAPQNAQGWNDLIESIQFV